MQRPRVFFAVAVLCSFSTSVALAVTRDWTNNLGGTFSTAANWTPVGVPGSSDVARFSLPDTYTVNLIGSATINTLTQTKGDVTLDLDNHTLLATNTTSNTLGASGVQSTLRMFDGTFRPGNLIIGDSAGTTGVLILESDVTTLFGFGPLNVGNSGTGHLFIENGSTVTNSSGAALGVNDGGVGKATVAGTDSLWTINNSSLRVGSNGTGTLTILANGAVTAPSLEVGEFLNSVGTISMSGDLATFTTAGIANIGGNLATAPAASATLNIDDGATMNLNGTTNFRTNATVNISGGQLNLSVVNITPGATFNWTGGTINFATAPTITPSLLDLLLDGGHTLGNDQTLSATAGTFTLTTPLTLTGGTISVPTFIINANMDIGPFSTVTATNTITLQPGITVQLRDFAKIGATTNLINNGGTLELHGPLANVTGPVANNAGTIRGTGRFVGGLNNNAGGTIRLGSSDHIIVDTVGPTNLGTIELSGGTVEYSNSLSNLAGGTISGRGVYRGSSATPGGSGLSNLGVLSFSAGITDIYGDVNNGAGGKIVAAGASTVTFFDDVVNNGDIRTVLGSRTVFFGSVSGAGTFTGGGTNEFEGDLKPGNSPANVTFGGNVELVAGAGLTIELAGTTKGAQYDSLTIAGTASLSGVLDVDLINGFIPSAGQSFNILTAAGGIDGTFDTTTLPALAGGLYFNLAYTPTAINLSVAGILGDYNKSGAIDAADYVLWRKTISQSGPALAADGNNNGTIDPADFTIWRTNYGALAAASGSGATLPGPIPEPSSLLIFLIATMCAALYPRCTVNRS